MLLTFIGHIHSDQSLHAIITERTKHPEYWLSSQFPSKDIHPSETQCAHCKSNLANQIACNDASIICRFAIITGFRVYSASCTGFCHDGDNQKYYFDGRDLGIINVDNRILCAIELVHDYCQLFLHSGLPIFAWWEWYTQTWAAMNGVSDSQKTRIFNYR